MTLPARPPWHPPTCFLCSGTGWVCDVHPETPYLPSRVTHCDCGEGVQCPLVAHGAAWFRQVDALVNACSRVAPRPRVVA